MRLLVKQDDGGFVSEPISAMPVRGTATSGEEDLVETSRPRQVFIIRSRTINAGDVIVWRRSHWEVTGVQAPERSGQRLKVHTQEVSGSAVADAPLALYSFVFCNGASALVGGLRMYTTTMDPEKEAA